MSVQQIWNLSQLLGLFTFCKLAKLSWNFVTESANKVLKLQGVDYVVKNWALAMMSKALPLVHFWSTLLVKDQMMTSVRKKLKTLVWSAKNRVISSEICAENNHKISRFVLIAFRRSLPRKFPWNRPIFPQISPQKSLEIRLFFCDLSEALQSVVKYFSGSFLSSSLSFLIFPTIQAQWIWKKNHR